MMRVIKPLLILGIVIFAIGLALAFEQGQFLKEGSLIYSLPWGKIMLMDLYIGFSLFALFIGLMEKSWVGTFFWVLSLLVLGNIVALIYLLYRWKETQRLVE